MLHIALRKLITKSLSTCFDVYRIADFDLFDSNKRSKSDIRKKFNFIILEREMINFVIFLLLTRKQRAKYVYISVEVGFVRHMDHIN